MKNPRNEAKLKRIHSDNYQWNCRWYAKISFRIICAVLLRWVALFVMSVLEKIQKPPLNHLWKKPKTSFWRNGASKFGLSFDKFSCSLVAWTDTTGAFKTMTIKFWYNWQFYEYLINNTHGATVIASKLFWKSLKWFSWSLENLRNLFLNFVIKCSW